MVGSGSSPLGSRLSLALASSPGVSFESFARGSNVWLLPLLQRFVCRDDLGFFVKHILPGAAEVQQRAEEASAEGRAVESGDWYRVYRQLWGLLPAFCTQPLDMPLTLGRGAAGGSSVGGQTIEAAPALISRVLEFIHDSFLRETACAAIVALAKSAAPPGAETPQLQQQQQNTAVPETKDAAKGSKTTADQHLLGLLRRLSDAAAAAAAADAPAAAAAEVRACAEAAARAARLCFQVDNALVAAAVTAAATWEANTQVLGAYAEETIGFLTVRYLLLHKVTAADGGAAAARSAEAAFAALSEAAKAKAAQQTLQAIQAFAPLCSRQLMEKNVKRFAGALLSSVSSSKPAPLAPKESAALLHVCDALRPFTAADIGAQLFQVLLTLLRQCTAALDADSSSSNSRVLLRALQRKAYGTLKHALDCPDSDADVLPASVPEVLLSLKDSNRRSRELAAVALESLGHLCEGTQVHLIALATLIAAGFGGVTAETEGRQGASGTPPFLKAAAALAMGRFFDLHSGELPHSQVRQWAEVGLLLLKDHNRTVFNAGLYFTKACIRAGDMDDLAVWLPSMLAVLDNPNAAKARMKIRHLIEKLCRLMATQDIDEESEASAEEAKGALAESETETETEDDGEGKWRGCAETMRRAAQPTRLRKASAREAEPDADSALAIESGVKAGGLKSLLDAFEADSEDERRSRGQRKRQASSVPAGGLCVFEGADGADASSAVLDFCSVSAAQQILVGMQPRKDRRTEQAERGAKRERKFSMVKVNEEGKIVIEEEEEDAQDENGTSGSSSSGGKKNLSCLAARRAALREMRKQQSGGHILQRSGADFKAKKAKGDLKTKGGVEPYAFVKLNRGVLKEKYRAQAVRSLLYSKLFVQLTFHCVFVLKSLRTVIGKQKKKSKTVKPSKGILKRR
ncbi:hypothetical protein ACSSS7_001002 [Eimeria intestinalis]